MLENMVNLAIESVSGLDNKHVENMNHQNKMYLSIVHVCDVVVQENDGLI